MKKYFFNSLIVSIPFLISELFRGIYYVFYLKSFDEKFYHTPWQAFFVHVSVGFITSISILFLFLITSFICDKIHPIFLTTRQIVIGSILLFSLTMFAHYTKVLNDIGIDYIDFARIQILILLLTITIFNLVSNKKSEAKKEIKIKIKTD